jgi:hypothetical protein
MIDQTMTMGAVRAQTRASNRVLAQRSGNRTPTMLRQGMIGALVGGIGGAPGFWLLMWGSAGIQPDLFGGIVALSGGFFGAFVGATIGGIAGGYAAEET